MTARLASRCLKWNAELAVGRARPTFSVGVALSAFQGLEEILRVALASYGLRELSVQGVSKPITEMGIGQCVRALRQEPTTATLLSTTELRELVQLARVRNQWVHDTRPKSASEVREALTRIARLCASPGFEDFIAGSDNAF